MTRIPIQRDKTSATVADNQLSFDTIKQDINGLLQSFYDDKIAEAAELDDKYASLWKTMHAITTAGGKRIRPYLLIVIYSAYGGSEYDTLLPVAAAQELLHVSLLIHDDIIDKDYVRHGQANLSGSMRLQYASLNTHEDLNHYANAAALLGGDLLISSAYQLITKSMVPAHQKMIALNELSKAIFYVGGGEFLDMESAIRPFEETNALKIADLKTARYSFAAPLRTGGLLAGISESEATKLEHFSVSLGIAYQLADDILGIFGDEVITGKSTLSDIEEGKHTYLMEQTLRLASRTDAEIVRNSLGSMTITAQIAKDLRAIVQASGALEQTKRIIDQYTSQARTQLNQLAINASSKAMLGQLIISLTDRVQ